MATAGSNRRRWGITLAVALAVLAVGAGTVAAGPAVDDATGTNASVTAGADVAITHSYNLTPDQPGSVRITIEYDVRNTNANPPVIHDDRLTVVSNDGFEQTRTGYRWDGSTEEATLVARVRVNRTSEYGSFKNVDVGDWAFFRTVGAPWTHDGSTVDFETTAEGPVATGNGAFVFLGPHEVLSRDVSGQTLRVVVPDAAQTAAFPATILDRLASSSRQLSIGGRDHDTVTGFAVPSPVREGGLTWPETDDYWVGAGSGVDTWVHEYVHTRQEYDYTNSGYWTVEATAEFHSVALG